MSYTSLDLSPYITVSSLKPTVKGFVRLLDESTVGEVLGKYLRTEELNGLVDPKELAALILWLEYVLELRVIDVAVSREFSFVEVDIADCGWEEWGVIARVVKGELVNEGLERLAGKVAVVCPEGLRS